MLHYLCRDKLQALLNNEIFKERCDYYSSIVKDTPLSPVEKATFYVEYMIRHKGAPFLRPPSKDLYWFQYLLLDVIAFVLSVALLCLFIVYQFLRCIWVCLFRRKSDVKVKKP